MVGADGWMDGWTGGRTDGRTDGWWMDGWMGGWMDGWMRGWWWKERERRDSQMTRLGYETALFQITVTLPLIGQSLLFFL